jgi:methyl-accepting chemotaxis protein
VRFFTLRADTLGGALAITVGLVALLTTFGVSLAAYLSARETIEGQIAKELAVVSRQTVAAEDAYLSDRVEEIRQLVFSQLEASRTAQQTSLVLFDYSRAFGELRYVDLSVLGLDGRVISSTGTPVVDQRLTGLLRTARRPGIIPAIRFSDQALPLDVVFAPIDTVDTFGPSGVSSTRTGSLIARLQPTEMVHLLRSVPIEPTTSLFLTRSGVLVGESRGAHSPKFDDDRAAASTVSQQGPYDLHYGVTALVDADAAYAPVRDLALRSVIIGIVVFLIAATMAALFARRIARPLGDVALAAHRFAQGDLAAHVETGNLRLRELRDLGASFNLLSQTLRSVIEGIETTSRTIFVSVRNNLDMAIAVSTGTEQQAGASALIASALGDVGAGARQIGSDAVDLEQRSRVGLSRLDALVGEVDRTNGVVGRLSDSIDRSNEAGRALASQASAVAQHAKLSGERAVQASRSAEEGRNAVRGLISDIQDVGSSLLDTVERLEHLADASAVAIQAQIGVVADMAERSKLLALNAGIEAARAGESGRGFAVIAGELHRLATGSRGAGDEASLLVRDVVAETQSLIVQARAASDLARGAIGRAGVTGQAIDGLVAEISANATGAREIGAIADDQAQRSHEIEVATAEMRELAVTAAKAAQTVWDLSREVRGAVDLATNVAAQVSLAAGAQIDTFAVIQQNARDIGRATAAAAGSAQESLNATHRLQREVEALGARLGRFAGGSRAAGSISPIAGSELAERAAARVEVGVA